MSQPLVSCICLTYNRPPRYQHLVEEAVESFLRQDYPNKELILLNDCPGQELVCHADGVIVVNSPFRFPTLGEKWNTAVQLSHGQIIAPWDDDDISLPWRLSYSVERLGTADYFNLRKYWYLSRTGLSSDASTGYAHNGSVYTRRAFDEVGGHKPISLGLDRELDRALMAKGRNVVDPKFRGSDPAPLEKWFYIYRWNVSPVHLSGTAGTDGREHYESIGKRPVVPATFYLQPHWEEDYVGMTRLAIENTEAENLV